MDKQIDFEELHKQTCYADGVPTQKAEPYALQYENLMIYKTIDNLELKTNVKILEISIGKAQHIPFILQKADGICYYGIDSSEELVKRARLNHILKIKEGHVRFFKEKQGGVLDFQNDFFDQCFTANTLYFWENPILQFMEVYRVLRPGGKFTLAFTEKKHGGKLPWTQTDFTFYDFNEVKKIFRRTGFVNIEVKQMIEEIIGEDGQEITVPFVIMTGQKLAG